MSRAAPILAQARAAPVPSPAPAHRIMIVLHDFSGGGTERVAIRLANAWAEQGRTVAIFCGTDAGPLRSLVSDAVTVRRADPVIARGLRSRVRLGHALARAAADFRPDILFGPGNFHLPVLAAFARRYPGDARIVCKISNPLVRSGAGWARRMLRRLVLRRLCAPCDALIAMSPGLRDEAAAHLPRHPILTCWEPLFAVPADRPVIAREPGLIVAVGRLEPQKNFACAIEMMARIDPAHSARLVILGDGSQRAQLTGQIRRLGLADRVALPGHVPDVAAWLARAACFVMTSTFEGYPAVLMEALACGTPAVVTPCTSALPEMTRQTANVTVTADFDPATMAAAVSAVLDRPTPLATPPLLLRRHDQDRAAHAYLELFDRLPARSR